MLSAGRRDVYMPRQSSLRCRVELNSAAETMPRHIEYARQAVAAVKRFDGFSRQCLAVISLLPSCWSLRSPSAAQPYCLSISAGSCSRRPMATLFAGIYAHHRFLWRLLADACVNHRAFRRCACLPISLTGRDYRYFTGRSSFARRRVD